MAAKSFFSNQTIQKQALLRAYPEMSGSVQVTNVPLGESKYHHVEATFAKRFSSGTTFNVSYVRTWQRDKDWFANEFDDTPRWRESNRSRPHSLTVNAVVELPFGPGRRYLQSGWVSPIVRDWQISGIYYYRTGSVISFDNVFWYGDTPANPLDPNDPVYRVIANPSGGQSRTQWFNIAPFYPAGTTLTDPAARAAVANQTGPAPYHRRVFPSRFPFIRDDDRSTADLSIARTIRLSRSMRMQLRADFINAFNAVEWSGPSVSPASTNFALINEQSNTPRWLQLQARFSF
jgi:hypothetical protein